MAISWSYHLRSVIARNVPFLLLFFFPHSQTFQNWGEGLKFFRAGWPGGGVQFGGSLKTPLQSVISWRGGAGLLTGGFKPPLASTHFTDLFPPFSFLPEDILYFNFSHLRSLISIFSPFPASTFSIRVFSSPHPLSFSAPSLFAFSDLYLKLNSVKNKLL